MNLSELQDAIAQRSGLTKKDAGAALTAFVEVVGETLRAGGDIKVPQLGVFSASQRTARKGRNPATGAEIDIPASVAPKFKAAKHLTESLNA